MLNKITCSFLFALLAATTAGCKSDDVRAVAHGVAQTNQAIEDAKRAVQEAQQRYNHNAQPYSPNNTASAGTCDDDFYQKNRPIIPQKQLASTQFLCFNGFSVLYSAITRTPLWSAEYLTKDRLERASQMARVDNFHEEPRLPADSRSTLEDYRGTGYDRGHLSPNADMGDTQSQYDSFSLVNIAPQEPELNRKAWMYLESNVRKSVYKYGEAYVVTGVAFLNPTLKKIHGRVTVPSHFYKAVLIPRTGQITTYISENSNDAHVQELALSQFAQITGVQPFPGLTNIAQANTAIKSVGQ